MSLEDISKDYLRRLLASKGIKLGSSKEAAMVAIIELLDENSLDGLLKSIRDDYDRALALVKQVADLRGEVFRLEDKRLKLQSELEELRCKKDALDEEIRQLLDMLQNLEFEGGLAICHKGDAAKLRAYKIAIDAALEKAPQPLTAYCYAAIVKSACFFACDNPIGSFFDEGKVEG